MKTVDPLTKPSVMWTSVLPLQKTLTSRRVRYKHSAEIQHETNFYYIDKVLLNKIGLDCVQRTHTSVGQTYFLSD